MNLSYKDFMRTSSCNRYFDDLEIISHGSNKESFKEVYEDYCLEESVEIYKCDSPKILRFGFVIIDGDIREWHIVRINAWGSHDNFVKEMNGEKK